MAKKEKEDATEIIKSIIFFGGIMLVLLGVSICLYLETRSSIDKEFTDQVQESLKSVVHIYNNTQGWQGSGVAITEDIILTARHVVEGGVDFTITTNEGKELESVIAISNSKYDLAFIKVSEPNLVPAKLGSVKDCVLGQQVYCIGSPYGKLNFNSLTLGIVSGLDRNCDVFGEHYGWSVAFTTDSAGHPGNSGCPVFSMDGVVRGILVGGHSPVLIYCMPVDLILEDIDEIDIMFILNKYFVEEIKDYVEYGYSSGDVGSSIGEDNAEGVREKIETYR